MWKSNLLPVKIFKGALIAVGVFLAIFLYSFLGSKIQQSDPASPAAYGVDSLEYEAPPVMYLTVWQRNERSYAEHADISIYSPFFYTKTELPLKEGNTILSVTNLNSVTDNTFYLPFTVSYDGFINGQYDIQHPELVFYGGNSDKVPAPWVGQDEFFYNDDASFQGDKNVSFSIQQLSVNNYQYYRQTDDTPHKNYAKKWLSNYKTSKNFDEDRFFEIQNFLEVYPDAPEIYAMFERSVTTTSLTINAMHPKLPDVIVATAVLEIRTYSLWDAKDSDINKMTYEEHITFNEYPNSVYSEITVLSYEQSDSFAWEQ